MSKLNGRYICEYVHDVLVSLKEYEEPTPYVDTRPSDAERKAFEMVRTQLEKELEWMRAANTLLIEALCRNTFQEKLEHFKVECPPHRGKWLDDVMRDHSQAEEPIESRGAEDWKVEKVSETVGTEETWGVTNEIRRGGRDRETNQKVIILAADLAKEFGLWVELSYSLSRDLYKLRWANNMEMHNAQLFCVLSERVEEEGLLRNFLETHFSVDSE